MSKGFYTIAMRFGVDNLQIRNVDGWGKHNTVERKNIGVTDSARSV